MGRICVRGLKLQYKDGDFPVHTSFLWRAEVAVIVAVDAVLALTGCEKDKPW